VPCSAAWLQETLLSSLSRFLVALVDITKDKVPNLALHRLLMWPEVARCAAGVLDGMLVQSRATSKVGDIKTHVFGMFAGMYVPPGTYRAQHGAGVHLLCETPQESQFAGIWNVHEASGRHAVQQYGWVTSERCLS
jgi:hypothetical protein